MEKPKSMVYLDHNATTPLASSVTRLIASSLHEGWGNPSSNNKYGILAKNSIETARQHVAAMIGANISEIVFTSGGTESNNMVIKGIPAYFSTWRKMMEESRMISTMVKAHIITSNVEHDATIMPLRYLQQNGEIIFTEVPVGPTGCITVDSIMQQIRPTTCLVTIMHANNETGVIMPLDEIGRKLVCINRERKKANLPRILLHTDAAQTIGKVPINVDALQVDYMSIVGHKFYGPRIGAVFRKDNDPTGLIKVNPAIDGCRQAYYIAPLHPLLHGGGQERGMRPGTLNTPMIVGLGEAARLIKAHLGEYISHMLEIRGYLEDKLQDEFGSTICINCTGVPRLPNTTNVSFIGDFFQGHAILSCCRVIMASTASACHEQSGPSRILINSGVQHQMAANAIRLSIGRDTTRAEIDLAIEDLAVALKALFPL